MAAAAAAQIIKSPEAFRTISEVACELDVPQHVLRFWETRFSQVRPVKRAGGRRYYRPEDVDLLRGIRSLLYSDGYTIRGVQKLLREQGVKYVASIGRTVGPSRPGPRLVTSMEIDHAAVSDEAPRAVMDEARRVKLELLLAELLQMKERLRAARARLRV